MQKPHIKAEIARLKAALDESTILSAQELCTQLSEIAAGIVQAKTCDRLKAAALLAKIRGYEAPTKVDLHSRVSDMSEAALREILEKSKPSQD